MIQKNTVKKCVRKIQDRALSLSYHLYVTKLLFPNKIPLIPPLSITNTLTKRFVSLVTMPCNSVSLEQERRDGGVLTDVTLERLLSSVTKLVTNEAGAMAESLAAKFARKLLKEKKKTRF